MGDYEVHNNIALLICKNPPVNQLSYNLRVALNDGITKALSDPEVRAIVIICDGRTFIAGADITEFATGKAFQLPIGDILARLDKSPKPTIAAIHGTALGGGFEVALSCHYRIGTSRCKVGLPEVLIGLLPGAGGTQRLPRLVGPILAAEMICSGKHVKAPIAYQRGILDQVVPIAQNHNLSMERLILRQAAIRFAVDLTSGGPVDVSSRVLSSRPCPTADRFFYDMMSQQFAKRARGFIAPQLCLQAVRAAQTSESFAAGMKKERQLFMKLASGTQSRALQHIFFAQRQIGKVPGVDLRKALPIRKVGIIGCGTMGGGILMNFVQCGIPVVVLEVEQRFLDKGLGVVQSNWQRQVKKGRLPKATLQKYMGLITPTTSYEDLSDCDIVIEAVFERLDIKHKVFKELDRVCKRDCILASNTSFLDIRKIASCTSRPERVIGTHFFAPANKMQLLENVRHELNDEVSVATVQVLAKKIKKKGVLVNTCHGFVGNRMYMIQGTEASRLVLEGAMPEQVDNVLRNKFGMAMGIFAVGDLSGVDIGYKSRLDQGIIDDHSKSFVGADYYPFDVEDTLVKQGRLGLKVGRGVYDYPNMRTRKPEVSKEVTKLIIETSKRRGIVRRQIGEQEIIERCFYTMINEGMKILEEGIAIRPSDIDVVFVFGYGFPAYRGGIMHYGDTVGIRKVRDTLLQYSRKYPQVPYFQPCALMNELADGNLKLDRYWKKKMRSARAKL